MTQHQLIARTRTVVTPQAQNNRPVALRAAGLVAVIFLLLLTVGPVLAAPELPGPAPRTRTQVLSDRTEILVPAGSLDNLVWVPLPGSARNHQVTAHEAGSLQVTVQGPPRIMRGVRMLPLLINGQTNSAVTIQVDHDGNWGQSTRSRGAWYSPALHGHLGVPAPAVDKSRGTERGVYLVVHPPAFANQIAPLVDWKTRKGYRVMTVSTAETGATTEGILDFIQNAYDSWTSPPEYILLMGDVDEIPTFNLSGNPTDLPYVHLEGDDWLPDAMVGRLPVENDTEARTVINKIVGYERTPDVDDGLEWFTRSVMVAGVEGSETPPHTVTFCGEQLESIGFEPAMEFLHPPLPSNAFIASMFNPTLDLGASMVAYRGWAYGTSGWSDPRYEVNDMGGLNNGAKLPVVMSFVCLNGDYTASSPCFGEAFLRLGLPDEPRGAVAFIGNGEHWSHTRFNDAMAISFFENIVDPSITDLGSLMNASKLRFADYFPHQMEAADQPDPEESVEFYFHIYNLLGDPELDFWKTTPVALDLDYAPQLHVGANQLAVTVSQADGGPMVPRIVVTAVRDGNLLGSAVTDLSGLARVPFPPLEAGQQIELTATGAGHIPAEAVVSAVSADAFVAVPSISHDGGANEDGVASPGETLAVTCNLQNTGSGSTGEFTLTVTDITGPASFSGTPIGCANLTAGATRDEGPLSIQIFPEARQGDEITLVFSALRDGGEYDISTHSFPVVASGLHCVALGDLEGGNPVQPGVQTQLQLELQNDGAFGTTGGTVTLELVPYTGAQLLSDEASFGACEPGASVVTTSPGLNLELADSVPAGTQLSFLATLTTDEGQTLQTTCGLLVGEAAAGNVSGPDEYGYYAYDSADLEYPAGRPVYQWNEISTAMGGAGTKLDFPADNYVVDVLVDLPFTFTYYGQDYDRIRVADNGWIAFDLAPEFNFYNWPLPSQHGNNALVAPFWENLVPSGDGLGNGLAPDGIYHHHDALNGTFTVEWSRLHHYQPDILGFQTFQVVLLDPTMHPTTSGDGEILFYYRDVTNNDHLRQYASVGIEDPSGTGGLQLSYAAQNAPGLAPLQPGLAIRLTTEAPVRVPYTVIGFAAESAQGRVQLEWQPVDDRPVLGWHVDCLVNGQVSRLTETPLPAHTRLASFQAPNDALQRGSQVRYRLTAQHPYGVQSLAGETTLAGTLSPRLALRRVSPNPGRGGTSIAFVMPDQAQARLRVYDAAGRLVRTLVDGTVRAGENLQLWDGQDDHGSPAAGGLYFFRLETGGRNLTRKFVLVR